MSWISGNRFLSRSEMENNAKMVWNYLGSKGWTVNCVSAILGNMQSESTINPGIWESLKPNIKRGYGLVQWTPASKYIDWAGSNYGDGNRQCNRLTYESANNIQWFRNPQAPTPNPPVTFAEFTKSNDDVVTLANYFLWYYEHPATTIQPKRGEQAKEWLAFLGGGGPDPPIPPTPPTWDYKKMSIVMYGKRRF